MCVFGGDPPNSASGAKQAKPLILLELHSGSSISTFASAYLNCTWSKPMISVAKPPLTCVEASDFVDNYNDFFQKVRGQPGFKGFRPEDDKPGEYWMLTITFHDAGGRATNLEEMSTVSRRHFDDFSCICKWIPEVFPRRSGALQRARQLYGEGLRNLELHKSTAIV